MRKTVYITALILLLVSLSSAKEKTLGAGLVIGNPTGITGKLWMGSDKALSMVIGWYNSWNRGYSYSDPDCYNN